jgi:hypothetical protein
MKKLIVAIAVLSISAWAKDQPTTPSIPDEVANAQRGVESLRGALRDPDSLVVERVYGLLTHKPGHPMICIVYRARNGFNGYTRDIAEYHGSSLMAGTLGPEGFGTFGSHCESVQRGWDRALRHGWADLTDEYAKAAPQQQRAQTPDASAKRQPSSTSPTAEAKAAPQPQHVTGECIQTSTGACQK